VLEARHILAHLTASQAVDGRWAQNYFPSGEAFWNGVHWMRRPFDTAGREAARTR